MISALLSCGNAWAQERPPQLPDKAPFETGDLASECRELIQDPAASLISAFNAGHCNGFISGVLLTSQTGSPDKNKTYCVPGGVTLGQVIGVFLKYADEYPSALHLDAGFSLVVAMTVAFPCGEEHSKSEQVARPIA
jgi:hypothetical protein